MKLTEKQKNCRCCHEKGGNHYVKPIKRTRKRQIAKAKHMMACHDQQVTSGHNGGTKRLESRRGGSNETTISK